MSDEEPSRISRSVQSDDRPSSSGTNRLFVAEEFARSLLGSVEKFHMHAKHRQSNVHVVNVLNLMQIGGASGSSKIDYDVVRSLIRSQTRKYSPSETFRIRGLATYSCRRLIMPMSHQLVSMDSLRTTLILGLDFSERIVSTLMVESQPPREDGAVPTSFLLVLSNLGRLRFCSIHSGECLHTFQLPIRRFKFKHIHWNKAFSEVWLLGRAVLPGNENGSERIGPSPSIAVFEIQPPRFKALLQLDKNVFQNIHAAGLEDDVLVTFNSSPHSCSLYSFDEIYRNHCTQVYDPVRGSERCENIGFNVKLSTRPRQLLDVKGDFSGVYFGGCCKVILCEPQTPREKYVLQEISSNEVPVFHDFRLLGPQQGVALAIDGSTMMLCKDDSSNFLRFEGIHLACYEVASMVTDPGRSEVRVRWRTALLPMRRSVTDGQWVTGPIYRDSVKTKFGRTSRATVTVPVVDNMPVRVLKTTYDGGSDLIHLLTLYDIANMDSCTSVGAEPDPEWISLVISIRGVSGEIYKITLVRHLDMDAMRKVDLVVEDEIMVLICYDGKNTIAEMYRLMEKDAKNWHPEIPVYGIVHNLHRDETEVRRKAVNAYQSENRQPLWRNIAVVWRFAENNRCVSISLAPPYIEKNARAVELAFSTKHFAESRVDTYYNRLQPPILHRQGTSLVEDVLDYTPSTLSRKQRRKQRAGRAPELQNFHVL